MVAEFDARRKVVVAGLNKLPGVSCATPKGAFYAFPNIKRTGWKAKPLASALLDDAGVAIIGGPDFGVLGEGYVRLSYANSTENILKALDRMELISAAHVDTPFDFEFMKPERAPDPMLTLEDVSAGYDGVAILKHVKMTLRPGARIGLLGTNGAGKSTLIKLLSGESEPLAGTRMEARGLAIGYFAQHQLEQLRPDESPLWHMANREPRTREQVLRDYLGGFDFRGKMAESAVAPFSGGEKSRLALALMIRTRPNLLLLDEPTNHLDLEMRHALNVALAEYEGSLVLVSHDRALLRSVCDSFLLVADGDRKSTRLNSSHT